ncbi:Prefoldin subunit 5 [Oopsacas minuta]|uniref:Prefoldin subunit 5 n=1 Tax=Oopsacas minuta TaxID=111878 RepID=A0AAV7JBA1_9METZ|nr:Prefoldin subunit 5 [Oopsacas minuta]
MAQVAGPIDIYSLQIPQLEQLRSALEEEIQILSNSLQQLKKFQIKFVESKECLQKFRPENKGKPLLVPLTSSMYVPGVLSNPDKVIVEVGTGFYIEKSISDAETFFDRRVAYVTEQMQKLQPTLQEKYQNKEAIVGVMQQKVQQYLASQSKEGAPKQ